MNTDVEVRAADPVSGAFLGAAAQIFTDVERRFSRFRTDSELSRLNARHGSTVQISTDLLALLAASVDLHRVTRGIFDPSILPELEASGYDRSFELITGDAGTLAALPPVRGFGAVEIDRARSTARLPHGMRLDLGGIGKGWAVDRAAEALLPCRDFLVNAGGDVYASGSDGYHAGWPVAIEHPHTGATTATVVIANQAIATSTTARRVWRGSTGEQRHHLIDPRIGACSRSRVASASVIARTAVEADVFAKTALIMGVAPGRKFLEDVRCPGLFVLDDGSVHVTAGWPLSPDSEGGITCNDAWR